MKPVTEKIVEKAMKQMKKKKSAGKDGVTQECLLLGKEILKFPLTRIINSSIETGVFPTEWKEAIVAPILKRGTQQSNQTTDLCLFHTRYISHVHRVFYTQS